MQYSYDKNKNALNIKKHGLNFKDAYLVIESGKTVTFEDNRFNYDEQRYVTLGFLGVVLVVIVTRETESEVRIISMRRATRHEREIYNENI